MQKHYISGAGGDAIAPATSSRRKFLFAMAGSAATLPAVALAGATSETPRLPQLSDEEQVAMLRYQLARMRQDADPFADNSPTLENMHFFGHDATISYLKSRFEQAAEDLSVAADERVDRAFKQMVACAGALALIPAHHPLLIDVKRQIANWSCCDGRYTLRLPSEIQSALLASADQDDDTRLATSANATLPEEPCA